MSEKKLRFDMLLEPSLRNRINDWRRQHPDMPSIGSAIHLLVKRALEGEATQPATVVGATASARPSLPPLPDGSDQTEAALNTDVPLGTHALLAWYQEARRTGRKKFDRRQAVNELLRDGIERYYAAQVGAIGAPADPAFQADDPLKATPTAVPDPT
jgi:hypothetical protein